MTAASGEKVADPIYPVGKRLLSANAPKPYVSSMDEYKQLWEQSVNQPQEFFGKV